jgi:hypothetical protein
MGLTRQKAVVEDVVWPVGHGSVVLGDVPAP